MPQRNKEYTRVPLRYDAGAGAYDRLTGRWSRLFAPESLDAAHVSVGDRILDVATGTADAALAAAARVGSSGVAVAADLSLPMLLIGKSKTTADQLLFVGANAQALPFASAVFDAVICLFGLMFFPDKVAALRGFRRVLRPQARVVITVWGPPHRAAFGGFAAEALAAQLPADREDLLRPFSLAEPRHVEQLLSEAGFADISVTHQIRSARFLSFEDFWEPIEAGGGRLGQAYLSLPKTARDLVRATAQERVRPLSQGEQIVMELEAYLATGVA